MSGSGPEARRQLQSQSPRANWIRARIKTKNSRHFIDPSKRIPRFESEFEFDYKCQFNLLSTSGQVASSRQPELLHSRGRRFFFLVGAARCFTCRLLLGATCSHSDNNTGVRIQHNDNLALRSMARADEIRSLEPTISRGSLSGPERVDHDPWPPLQTKGRRDCGLTSRRRKNDDQRGRSATIIRIMINYMRLRVHVSSVSEQIRLGSPVASELSL